MEVNEREQMQSGELERDDDATTPIHGQGDNLSGEHHPVLPRSALTEVSPWRRAVQGLPDHPVAKWLAFVIGVVVPLVGLLTWMAVKALPNEDDAVADRLDLKILGSLNDEPSVDMTSTVLAAPGSTVHVRIRYTARTRSFLDDVTLRMVNDGNGKIVPSSMALTTAVGTERLPDTALTSGGVNVGDYTAVESDSPPQIISGQIQLLYTVDATASCTIRLTVIGRAVGLADSPSVLLIPLDLNSDGTSDTGDC